MLSKRNRPGFSHILIKSSLLLGSVRSKSGFREALWMSQKQAQKNLPPFPKTPTRAQPRHHQKEQRMGVSIASIATFRVKMSFLKHELKA